MSEGGWENEKVSTGLFAELIEVGSILFLMYEEIKYCSFFL
jgi:hypothetical protein